MYYSARTCVVLLIAVMLTSAAVHAQEEDVDAPVAVGSAAPDFTITSEENEFSLSSLEGSQGDGGKYTVLVFVRAHW